MVYLLAAGAGIAGALIGWFATGMLAVGLGGLFGMSDFEGGRGMFAFLGVGPIGGLAGLLAGVWLVLRRRPGGASLAKVGGVLVGVVGLAGAGIALRLLTIDTYSNEAPPRLEFEISVPPAISLADRGAVSVELHTDRNVGDGILYAPWPRADGDAQVLAGSVELAFKTSGRLLVVELPGEPTRLFRLGLSRNPASTPALGDWHRADHVHHDRAERPVAAPADDPVRLRYHVRRAGED